MYLALIDFFEFSIDRAELSDFDGAAMVAIHRDLVEAIDAGEGPKLDAAIEAHQPRAAPREPSRRGSRRRGSRRRGSSRRGSSRRMSASVPG